MAATLANSHSQNSPQRNYQAAVVAAISMGIRKDGEKNAAIMGRKTWESVPLNSMPLPDRLNVILTRSGNFDFPTVGNVVICGSMSSA